MNKNHILWCIKIITIIVSAYSITACNNGTNTKESSTEQWSFISGSTGINAHGVYGTKGIPIANNVPGARQNAVSWTDQSGNMWLFGGNGYDSVVGNVAGQLNDLWKFNSSTSLWTWVSGANTISQIGNYGTLGVPLATNVPGARSGAISWADGSGNLWLFSGQGFDSNSSSSATGYLNDLWKYNITSARWTWVAGANIQAQYGTYGTKGIPLTINIPGARVNSISWMDSSGNMWLFGGSGNGSSANVSTGDLNDLWKYNPTNATWVWVSGADIASQVSVYGTKNVAATSNVPGGRFSAVSWIDNSGNMWLFGGQGYAAASLEGLLNDLWKYDPNTSQWTWVSGANVVNAIGIYGTMNTAAATNLPGSRVGAISWVDTSNNLWLFGGYGIDSIGNIGYLNDLWKYSITNNTWTWISGGSEILASGSPSYRSGAVSWNVNSIFWLFGGTQNSTLVNNPTLLNDLWNLRTNL